ncbi:BppU family phage baseplate upper protein [Enterococcus sp. AZ103]|uniref:BppU family phage baseplate upper protein n=1 Tax=Enterococcus sp. AZ103 TaxID=2774628 RepID=UPI003F213BB1
MANKILNLDLSKDPIWLPFVYGRVGDEKLQTITVNITNNDQQFSLAGYTVAFEGVTNGGKTKVFDSDNVKVTNASTGTFEYTFPSAAFSTPGVYERAYFSIAKSGVRNSTGDFKIDVSNNADIDAEEAQTVITEYNKLVSELNKLQKENINALTKQQTDYINTTNTKFTSIQKQIADLQTLIGSYETSVNSTKTTAITEINAALEQFKKGDFYSKSESDSRYLRYSVDQATNAEAIAGTTGLKWMSPSTTKVAISNQATTLTGNQTISGTKNFVTEPTVDGKPLTDKFVDLTLTSGFSNGMTGWIKFQRINDLVIVSYSISPPNNSGAWVEILAGNKIPDNFKFVDTVYGTGGIGAASAVASSLATVGVSSSNITFGAYSRSSGSSAFAGQVVGVALNRGR